MNKPEAIKILKEGGIVKCTNCRGYKAIIEKILKKYNVIMNAKGTIIDEDFDTPESAVVFAGIN